MTAARGAAPTEASCAAAGGVRAKAPRRGVLGAHMDTHRTPWIFTSPGLLAFFKTMTTLGVVAFVLCALLFLAFA